MLSCHMQIKPKCFRIRNICFFFSGSEIIHTNPTMSSSDYGSIAYMFQKNGELLDTITMHSVFCLNLCIVTWANTIQRIWTYPSTSKDTHVNCFHSKGKICKIPADDMNKA